MKLHNYLEAERITASNFARRVGVASSTITRLLSGDRAASLRVAHRIEKVTNGIVRTEDLDDLIEMTPGEAVKPNTFLDTFLAPATKDETA